MIIRCFACNKKLGKNPEAVDTRDDQHVLVGSECYKKIVAAGELGWKHSSRDSLRLWIIKDDSYRITGGGTLI